MEDFLKVSHGTSGATLVQADELAESFWTFIHASHAVAFNVKQRHRAVQTDTVMLPSGTWNPKTQNLPTLRGRF